MNGTTKERLEMSIRKKNDLDMDPRMNPVLRNRAMEQMDKERKSMENMIRERELREQRAEQRKAKEMADRVRSVELEEQRAEQRKRADESQRLEQARVRAECDKQIEERRGHRDREAQGERSKTTGYGTCNRL